MILLLQVCPPLGSARVKIFAAIALVSSFVAACESNEVKDAPSANKSAAPAVSSSATARSSAASSAAAPASAAVKSGAGEDSHVYATNGAHNRFFPGGACLSDACDPKNECKCAREKGQPPDPKWPDTWSSDWTMYRVFQKYAENPPPYADDGKAITGTALKKDADYEVSFGSTYYDATYTAEGADTKGVMMEYYRKRCLPIFPSANDYTCSFVSLGKTAYFLRFAEAVDGVPDPLTATSICLFSPDNHPPPTDFIAHLPYNAEDAKRLKDTVLAYSLVTKDPPILFGYAFEKSARKDGSSEAYQHPQSFYFSGSPTDPPNAPIVSQNYHGFSNARPPEDLWKKVKARRDKEKDIPLCHLFAAEGAHGSKALGARGPHRGWNSLGGGAK